ncbi:hypothetical protein AXP46_24220 [Salmonella enterica subsp. enterica]|nr:hypothetical protein [Salmonella enterica subsp. enterica serovar Braenderup]EAW1355085.1 hypothetical protein [Salmonella enterica subsp. enterica]EAW1379192.1 hypothetical protein [Salmonella enterica subsp. enterica]
MPRNNNVGSRGASFLTPERLKSWLFAYYIQGIDIVKFLMLIFYRVMRRKSKIRIINNMLMYADGYQKTENKQK